MIGWVEMPTVKRSDIEYSTRPYNENRAYFVLCMDLRNPVTPLALAYVLQLV